MSFSLRSFIGLFLSLLIHAGVVAYFFTRPVKPIEKPKQNKLALQVAMFQAAEPKTIAPPKAVKQVVEKVASKPAPKPKLKEKKPIKKAIKKKSKPRKKPVAKPKKIIKKSPAVKPRPKKITVHKKRKVKPQKKKVIQQKPRQVRKAVVVKHRKNSAKRIVRPAQKAPVRKKVKPRIVRPASRPKAVVKSNPAKKRPSQPSPAKRGNAQLEAQYGKSIRQIIQQKKVYPRRAKRRKIQGIVKVAFSINKHGKLLNLRIHQSSGSKILDKAALDAVKKAGVFPAMPAGINKQRLSYIIPISYGVR